MKHVMSAVYENGTFRPIHSDAIELSEGKLVRITVEDKTELDPLKLAMSVYEGLSDEDIDEIEQIACDRTNFFGPKDGN